MLKKWIILCFLALFLGAGLESRSQCSICTKTTQQLGEKPARGLNAGILYLALMPLALGAYIGIRWWRSNREN